MAKVSCNFRSLLPLIFMTISFLCVIMVGVGLRSKTSGPLQSLYFFRASAADFTVDMMRLADEKINNKLLHELQAADLDDFYTVGLWNYCSGTTADGKDIVEYCSNFKAFFWFDIKDVWAYKMNIQEKFPDPVNAGLRVYQNVAKWGVALYFVAILSTGASLILGVMLSFCCALGVCVVGSAAAVSSLLIITLSITITAMYGTLSEVLNKNLGGYGISCMLGRNVYILLWMAAVFSCSATVLWIYNLGFSLFGKSRKKNGKKGGKIGGKMGRGTYEAVGMQNGNPSFVEEGEKDSGRTALLAHS